MKNLVVVPAWNRPELLFLCLERLSLAHGIDHHKIIVVQDDREGTEQDPRIREVVAEFIHSLDISYVSQEKHRYPWPGRNDLLTLKLAYEMETPFIFYVEDDVMVARDFFDWHYAAQKFPAQKFCSIAARDPEAAEQSNNFFFTTDKFAGLGVCFPRESVGYILQRDIENYFLAPTAYIQKHYGFEPFGDGYYDWDGLVGRICFYDGLVNLRAGTPRCFHSGIYGANRTSVSRLKAGTWREQAAELRAHWADEKWMTLQYQDCYPCELEGVEYVAR